MLAFERPRLSAPYRALSSAYDQALGARFFARSRRTYEAMAERFGIVPRVAADLGAGTGLFAAWLSRTRRIRVYAVDRSGSMLRAGLSNMLSAGAVPLRQDIRALHLPEPVDLATAHYDTVNHLLRASDVKAAFAALARAVKPGGFFVFDFITPNQHPAPRCYRLRAKHGTSVIQRVQFIPQAGVVQIAVIIRRRQRGQCIVERHLERAYSPLLIARWLNAAGFVVRGLFDAISLAPVTRVVPPRVVVVAQR